MSAADDQWLTLFKEKEVNISKISTYLPLKITSKEINNTKNVLGSKAKDARLLAKIDNREDLPAIFKEHGLFLLPIKNGEFLLLSGDGFSEINNLSNTIEEFESALAFELLSSQFGDSEMQHLDYAFNTGLLESHFKENKMYQTIRGRKYTPAFSFDFHKQRIDVEGVQIEVDGGYESARSIALIEAKNVRINNFVIRQLYYPFRTYKKLISEKEIKTSFFSHNNGVYTFHDFSFEDASIYNSIKQIGTRHYRIVSYKKVDEIKLPLSPSGRNIVPQADDLNKVLELIANIEKGIRDSEKMAEKMRFERRQSSYYREAAEALGFVYMEGSEYFLTEAGKAFIGKNESERKKFLARQILNIPIFFEAITRLLKERAPLNKNQVAELIQVKSRLNSTTAKRRSSTILSWFAWLGKEIEIISVSDGVIKLR